MLPRNISTHFLKGPLRLVADGRVLDGSETLGASVRDGSILTAVATQLSVSTSCGAHALWSSGSNKILTWGLPHHGGDNSAVRDRIRNITHIEPTSFAFAALMQDGSVVCWGDESFGGCATAVQEQLREVVKLCGSSLAFAFNNLLPRFVQMDRW